MNTNYFKGTFEKDGKRVTKEVTSTTKSSTQLEHELKDKYKEKGYKFVTGSAGSRSR